MAASRFEVPSFAVQYDCLIMSLKAFMTALSADRPVLFANIGWAELYNGTESVRGRHGWLKEHDRDNSEVSAFVKEGGFFRCGVGRHQAESPLHVVFVAVDPAANEKKIVGVYADAAIEMDGTWARARASDAVLIPLDRRKLMRAAWPGRQGIRRWARDHPPLRKVFERLKAELPAVAEAPRRILLDQTYSGMEAREGEPYELLVAHRRRDAKLRYRKIAEARRLNDGRLLCEVPRCGFDFSSRYGRLGEGYAHVHHRVPLAKASRAGTHTKLSDLAIVCANCHAMIHLGGECRDMEELIPRKCKR
jgi:HNH endonuclease